MRTRILPLLAILAGALATTAAPASAGRCGDQDCRADVSVTGYPEHQPIRVGEETGVLFEVNNNGPDTALAVEFKTVVPDGLQITKTEVYGNNYPSCTTSGSFVQCKLGDFVNYQKTVVKIFVRGTRTGTFLIPGEIARYDVLDPSGGNDKYTVSLPVQAASGSSGGSSSGGSSSGGTQTSSGGGGGAGVANLNTSAKDMQRILKTGGVTITATSSKSGTMKVRGSVRTASGGVIPLAGVARGVSAGQKVSIFLGTTDAAKARLRRAFVGHGYLEANFLVSLGVAKAKLQVHVKK